MLIHLLVIAVLIAIFYCLGSGVFFLVKADVGSTQLAKALTWRIALSMSLFLLLALAYYMGWIVPHSLMMASAGMR